MKIFKNILYGFIGIVVLILATALILKKDYSVEKQIVINKPKIIVFEYLKLLKNQDNFSKWAKMDPQMIKTYRGTDGTVGFVSAWESKSDDVGTGEQEIKRIVEGERIDYELRFIKPFAAVSPAWMTTEMASETETTVKWGFKGHMDWPMNLMLLFMDMEEMIGKDFEEGLTTLKSILESQS